MDNIKLRDNLKQAKDTLDNLLSLSDCNLSKLFNASNRVKESLNLLNKSALSINYIGKKATVKKDTTWIYAGGTFDILEVYMVHSGRDGVYEKGSMDLRLNLRGTKFEYRDGKEYRNTSTVINTNDLIILD